jgi:2-keto-4-pentenoate hydratase/2-oxohepta-3-ene-1,7-dioic acid hydratase in catechol pathway
MRIVRFGLAGRQSYGVLRDDGIHPLVGSPFETTETDDRLVLPLDSVHLLPPSAASKVVCVGRNYAAHAKELGHEVPAEPLLFLKPPSALLAHGGEIELPPDSSRVEHEGELAVVIGRPCRNAAPADVRDFVLGYTCFNDVTARDLQRRDVQFTRGKGFDTFAPCGPWIETELDPSDLRVQVRVGGVTRQDGRTSQMIFPIAELVAYVSRVMTLLPGDLVVTGTPEGVGPLVAGDVVEVEIEGIGTLRNMVRTA